MAAAAISRAPPAELVAGFDLRALSDDFYHDPYPTYRALQERSPVHRLPDGSWLLTRHADLEAVYRDPVRFSSDKTVEFLPKYGPSPLYEHHTTSLVFNDPPLHGRVRKIIIGALTPRAIAGMEAGLEALVDDLLERIGERGRADLIEDFAAAIPLEIIGNLFAVPYADRGPLRAWSLAILGALEPQLTAEQEVAGNRAVEQFLAFLGELLAERRKRPGDPEHDVLTRLLVGTADGAQLSESELLHNCIFILNAGHETTTNLIGNGLDLLLDWPGECRRLRDEPALIRSAVEEFLRFESSNQLGNRRTTSEVGLGGVVLPPGALLNLVIGAANRDPAAFVEPDRLDLGRTPNRHLAFASGPHQCAGLSLARLEARVAISRFLARFPDFARSGTPLRSRRARFRGFVSLPVEVG